jgi:putative peptidoglycan lipid II flippase
MSQMLKSSGAMAGATLTSRVLGMAREMVYARFMADGWVAGAFQIAFMVPNLFRRLLGEGALTAAFIPIFKEKEKNEGEAEMWRAANVVISGLLVASIVIVTLGILGVTGALSWIHFDDDQTVLMLHLLRIMFPYLLLVCLAAIFMGMLNARGHFFIPASGAIVLNLVMIASVLWLAPRMGKTLPQQIFALAIGVLVAGTAQAIYQLPPLFREGFRYRWVAPWGDPTVRRVVRQMVPGTIGVAAFQINVLMTQGVAFGDDPSIVASFNYAVRLMELPQGMFGISLATYLLPTLSGLAAEKKYDDFRSTLNHGVDHLVFINLLASLLLVILAEPIVRLLFEYGKFRVESTERVAFALECLAPGLIAFSLVNIFARAFYALGDTKTPMRISIFCLGVNLVFLLLLIWRFRQGGMGMANTMSAICNVCLLVFALRRKLHRFEFDAARRHLPSILGAAVIAGGIAWEGYRLWDGAIGHDGLGARLGGVFVPMTCASLAYGLFALWRKVPPAIELTGLLMARLRKPAS